MTAKRRNGTIIISILVIVLLIGYFTKPDNKTTIIEAVSHVWGNRMPTDKKPLYYNQFMDEESRSVKVGDWIFLKRVQFKVNDKFETIGFAAFSHVYFIR